MKIIPISLLVIGVILFSCKPQNPASDQAEATQKIEEAQTFLMPTQKSWSEFQENVKDSSKTLRIGIIDSTALLRRLPYYDSLMQVWVTYKDSLNKEINDLLVNEQRLLTKIEMDSYRRAGWGDDNNASQSALLRVQNKMRRLEPGPLRRQLAGQQKKQELEEVAWRRLRRLLGQYAQRHNYDYILRSDAFWRHPSIWIRYPTLRLTFSGID